MESQKQQVVERLQQANNILVTVSSNPSVDQLAACIGLTLALNKLGKHATAVFSGAVPSTIEFLQPEKTIEKNTDSLRDFIIALDKSKADKLRYKVEDRMVKIFITPYRTSISDKDLDFSQGDFNVDVVVALGVHQQSDLDQAITAHGRILHDATVMSVNVKPGSELGSVNWLDVNASSLSELGVQLVDSVDKNLMDGQIATAFLTGIVAETERFSNNKTSPQTMSISAELMSAGANQQLVATKLEEPAPAPQPTPIPQQEPKAAASPQTAPVEPPKPDDGTIEIAHDGADDSAKQIAEPVEAPETPDEAQAPQIHIDDHGNLRPFEDQKEESPFSLPPLSTPDAGNNDALPPITPLPGIKHEDGSRLLTDPEPPLLNNSPLTANALPDDEDEPSTDPLSMPSVGLLNREPLPSQQPDRQTPSVTPPSATPAPLNDIPHFNNPGVSPVNPGQPSSPFSPSDHKTLSQLEQDLNSPHLNTPGPAPVAQPQQPFMTPPPPTIVAPTTQPTENAKSNDEAAAHESPATVEAARNAVEQAINANPQGNLEPIQALNAQPLGATLHADQPAPTDAPIAGPMVNPSAPSNAPATPEPVSFEPTAPQQQGAPDGTTPPPVPPPMMPPSFPPRQ